MKYKVDRITEDIAVLEDENCEHIKVNLSELPKGIKEGSVVMIIENQFILNKTETNSDRSRIYQKQMQILKKK